MTIEQVIEDPCYILQDLKISWNQKR